MRKCARLYYAQFDTGFVHDHVTWHHDQKRVCV